VIAGPTIFGASAGLPRLRPAEPETDAARNGIILPMTTISLLTFLRSGVFGPVAPQGTITPEVVFAALGVADEVYNPSDLDRPYRRDDPRCFPLIASYGDIEFHFASATELATLFVDSFSGPDGAPDGGALRLVDTGLLRGGMTLAAFLEAAPRQGVEIQGVRPYAPPYSFVAATAGGVEVGFEHEDPDAPDSQARLAWFCRVPI